MEEENIEYPSELMRCKNCKYFKGGICHQSRDKSKVEFETNCINGYFESIDISEKLKEIYDNISSIIDYYMDLDKNIKNIITLWIIGTYFHENFQTFPYLFINAMKGSGKTRLLKIIASLSNKGQLVNSVTDAVMFRTIGALIIDEFEGVGGKDKNSLRELLNSAYKKGTKVFRMKKSKTKDGESQIVEQFEPYRPVVMANIWGMEEVLGDRCINILLEKSTDLSKIKLVENFNDLDIINETKSMLVDCAKCSLCSVVTIKNVYKKWNVYVKERYTLTTLTTLTTLNYTKLHQKFENIDNSQLIDDKICFNKDFIELFRKIDDSKLDGRYLELFFPLFLVSNDISDEILQETLNYSNKVINDKKIEEITESKDVLLYSYVAKQDVDKWRGIKEITSDFKFILGDGENEWMNSKWMGRALKRLNLIKSKKRIGEGIQVILDVDKAKLKEQIFKPKEK